MKATRKGMLGLHLSNSAVHWVNYHCTRHSMKYEPSSLVVQWKPGLNCLCITELVDIEDPSSFGPAQPDNIFKYGYSSEL